MKIVEKIKRKERSLSGYPALTIALFGDSVTQGCFECFLDEEGKIDTVFDAEHAYGTLLERKLNALYPKVPFNLIRAGISGDNTKGGLKRIKRDVLSYHPDLVIVGFALNDACLEEKGLPEYEKNLTKIVRKILRHGAECILLTPNAMNTEVSADFTEPSFLRLAEKLQRIQNDGVLARYAEIERKIARKAGATLCDVYAEWEKMIQSGTNVTELLANKLNHPTRQMHELTARMLCDCIHR